MRELSAAVDMPARVQRATPAIADAAPTCQSLPDVVTLP
jgi:hypothetical protein